VSSRQWVWLDPTVLLAVHEEQLAEHGGAAGTRDQGLFESALVRAQNLAAYGKPDAAELAAAYGYGIARNHPFIDGNKRTAFVAVELFLELNGFELAATDAECVIRMLAVAAGDISGARFASWLRANSKRRRP
jgi:death on curing protein